MSLNFAASGRRVQHGTGSSVNNLDSCTYLCWVKPTASNSNSRITRKGNGLQIVWDWNGEGNKLQVFRLRAGGLVNYITNAITSFASGTGWHFIVVSFNTGGGAGEVVNIYHGTPTAAATEATYSTTTDSSGALSDDSATQLTVGNHESADSLYYPGDIANMVIIDSVLSLSQIRAIQFDMAYALNFSDLVLFTCYGFNGTSTQADWSGNKNNGTVSSATVSSGGPVRPTFGRTFGWRGAFTAAGAPTGWGPLLGLQRSRLVLGG